MTDHIIDQRKFSRCTAYHEAGHVVGYCLLSDGIHLARVHPKGDPPIRVTIGSVVGTQRGAVQGRSFNAHKRGFPLSEYCAMELHLREKGLDEMAVLIMGFLAEARYRKCSRTCALVQGGWGDMRSVEDIANWLATGDAADARALRNEAFWAATLLVREYWHLIVEVAEKLAACGHLNGDDVLLRRIEPIVYRHDIDVIVAPFDSGVDVVPPPLPKSSAHAQWG